MLRLFREEHKYSLAFETSFRLHCRESPIEAYLKEEEGGREDPEKLGFGPFSETFSTRLVDDTLNYQKDAD